MTLPGTPSLAILFHLFVVLPAAAIRSARVLRGAGDGGAVLSREAIWIRTMVGLAVLLVLALLVGRTFDYDLFAAPPLSGRQYAMAVAALAAALALRGILRRLRPEAERRRLVVHDLAPRTRREWALAGAAILLASVAEEAAYRGVGMAILWYWTGNPWLSAGLCALAFALAHWMQGWRSGLFIFALALVLHALCVFTGTLLLAMAVHAVYDLLAAALLARDAARLRAGSAPGAA